MIHGLGMAKRFGRIEFGLLPLMLAVALLICGAPPSQAADWGIKAKDHKAKPQGAQVSRISSGSPADRAGLKKGDIILELSGQTVRSASWLAAMLKNHSSAKLLSLLVNRKGWIKEITLSYKKAAKSPQEAKPDHGIMLGRVSPKGLAGRAGLVKGDVITYLNGHKIFTQEDYDQVSAKLKPGQKISLTVFRNGWEKDLELRLSRKKADPRKETGPKPAPQPATGADSAAPAGGGYLGISMTNAPGEQDGALVKEVYQQSPAQKAGIKPGDIIIFFNGRKVFEGWDIVEETNSHGPGTRMEVSVLRGGKELDLDLVLGRKPRAKRERQQVSPPQSQPQPTNNSGDVRPGWLGVYLSNAPPQQTGVRVAKVAPNGPAHMVGIKAGDIITMVNGRKVNGTPDLVMKIRILPPGSRMQISLLRNGRGMVVHPVLGQKPPDAEF